MSRLYVPQNNDLCMFYLLVHEAPVDTLRHGVGLVYLPENLSVTTGIMSIGLNRLTRDLWREFMT